MAFFNSNTSCQKYLLYLDTLCNLNIIIAGKMLSIPPWPAGNWPNGSNEPLKPNQVLLFWEISLSIN